MMPTKIALVGSTGKIGPTILQSLLNAGFEVIILTRLGSSSTDRLPTHENQSIVKVDYGDIPGLTSALHGVEAVVSTLSSLSLEVQRGLIDASVAAGVKRFIPSEFACDLDNVSNRALPIYQGKLATQDYIKLVATSQPDFSYTIIYNNVWLDWGLQSGFILNAKEHKAILWDGGDVPFSTTRLSTVAKAIVAVLRNQEATRNRTIYIHDAAITFNQLIGIIKTIDGESWKTEVRNTTDSENEGYEELAKLEPDSRSAMTSFLYRAAFGQDHSPDFTDRLDNDLLGLPVLEGEALVDAVKESL